ncbi:MAG TPA: glycoside hydrolase family 6 protein [Galbitalea sp.]|nr:glycoside hydrolase family 6 protein [Galbitalea sp.]
MTRLRRHRALIAGIALGLAVGVGLLVLVGGTHPPRHEQAHPWEDSAINSAVFPGGLWVNPNSLPANEARQLRSSGQVSAATAVGVIASQPTATWLTDSNTTQVLRTIRTDLASSRADGTTPVFVTYAIPDRDCGDYSSGGFHTNRAYQKWNDAIAGTLRGHPAIVLIEPDSIAMLGRSSCAIDTGARLAVIRSAVQRFAGDHIDVYLDGGNSHWQKPGTMASRLRQAGMRYARGFFTNVSNFYPVDQERSYADKLSALLGGKHFVIDVSRDGSGANGSWCNPDGAALGQNPHVTAGSTQLDALLWVKTPGASDGTCDNGPPAGHWFESYALALVANRLPG